MKKLFDAICRLVEAKQDYFEGLFSTDFLIERGGKRVAPECKFNDHRDLEKTRITAGIIHDRLRCDSVFVVLPFTDEHLGAHDATSYLESVEGTHLKERILTF
jgi:hypothetical protein